MQIIQDKDIKYRMLSCFWAFFSIFPFCIDMSVGLQQSLYGNQILLCVLFLCFYSFYFKELKRQRQKKGLRMPAFILANIFTVILLFGRSYYRTASWSEIVHTSVIQHVKALLVYVGIAAMLYFMLAKIFGWTDTEWIKKSGPAWICTYSGKGIFRTGIIILACWSPYIILKYPGVTAWDTGTILKDFFDGQTINNGVPALTVLYFTFFIKIGDLLGSQNIGLMIFVCMQSMILSAVLSWGVCYMERCRVIYRYRFCLLLCICFLPLYPFTAIQMGSDVPYSVMVILYTFFLIRYVWKKESIKRYEWIFQSVVLVLMALLRHTGIYIVSLSFLILLILNWKKRKREIVWMHMSVISIYMIWNLFILPHIVTANVINTSSTILNITKQQIGNYIVQYNDFTEDEKQILNKLAAMDKVAERYNPELADPMFGVIHIGNKDTAEYLKLWAKLFFRHPDAYIQAAINMWYGYYYPDYTCKTKVHIFTNLQNVGDSEYLQIQYPASFADGRRLLDSWNEILLKAPFTSTLYRIGFYTWMFIFSVVYIIWKRQWSAFAMLAPPGLTLLICMLSPVCGYTRYAYPIMFTMPFLCGLWFTYGDKNKDTADSKKEL